MLHNGQTGALIGWFGDREAFTHVLENDFNKDPAVPDGAYAEECPAPDD